MAEQEKGTGHAILQTIADNATAENIQKYILGTKKSGHPRALYDVVKDYTKPKKKKKKKKGGGDASNPYGLFLSVKKGKKKKKKKGKKHWKF